MGIRADRQLGGFRPVAMLRDDKTERLLISPRQEPITMHLPSSAGVIQFLTKRPWFGGVCSDASVGSPGPRWTRDSPSHRRVRNANFIGRSRSRIEKGGSSGACRGFREQQFTTESHIVLVFSPGIVFSCVMAQQKTSDALRLHLHAFAGRRRKSRVGRCSPARYLWGVREHANRGFEDC